MKVTLNWPEDRWDELQALRGLLFEVSSLNRGNMHLERTAKCIAIAEKLLSTTRDDELRVSFVLFLEDLAISRGEGNAS